MSVTLRIPEFADVFWAKDAIERALEPHRQIEDSIQKIARESLSVSAIAREALRGVTHGIGTRELARQADMAHMIENVAMAHAEDLVGRNRFLEDIVNMRSAKDMCGASSILAMSGPMTALDACDPAGMMNHVSTISSFGSTLQQLGDAQTESYRTLASGSSISETIEAISQYKNLSDSWQTDTRSIQEFISGVATALPDTASIMPRLSAVDGYSDLHVLTSEIRHALAAPADVLRTSAFPLEQFDALTRSHSSTIGHVENTDDHEAHVASPSISDSNIDWISEVNHLVESLDRRDRKVEGMAAPASLPNEHASPEVGEDPSPLTTQLTVQSYRIRFRLRSLSPGIVVKAHQQCIAEEVLIHRIATIYPEVAALWTQHLDFMELINAPRGQLKGGGREDMDWDDLEELKVVLDAIEAILDRIDQGGSRS